MEEDLKTSEKYHEGSLFPQSFIFYSTCLCNVFLANRGGSIGDYWIYLLTVQKHKKHRFLFQRFLHGNGFKTVNIIENTKRANERLAMNFFFKLVRTVRTSKDIFFRCLLSGIGICDPGVLILLLTIGHLICNTFQLRIWWPLMIFKSLYQIPMILLVSHQMFCLLFFILIDLL